MTAATNAFLHNEVDDEIRRCLADSAGQLAVAIDKEILDLIYVLDRMFGPFGKEVPPDDGGVIALVTNVVGIIRLQQELFKKCSRGRAVQALDKVKEHMKNITYIEGHLVANGADILSDLASVLVDFRHNNSAAMGTDVGHLCRKVFLSDAVALPEWPPPHGALENASAGLAEGFFGEGITIGLLDDVTKQSFKLDVDECFRKNLPIFQEAWQTPWLLIAKYAETMHDAEEKNYSEWQQTVASLVLALPNKMRKHCGMNKEQVAMLKDSLEAARNLHFKFSLPGVRPEWDELVHQMAAVVSDWEHGEWFEFGRELGLLLQGLILSFFPLKYTVDGGVLREVKSRSVLWSGSYVVLGILFVVVWATASLRRVRIDPPFEGLEGGSDEDVLPEAVE